MNNYIFDLGCLGEVKISAINRVSAMEQFVDMGYDPQTVTNIDVEIL